MRHHGPVKREALAVLPHVGVRELFPGLSVATMPRASGVQEVVVEPQDFSLAMYARRGRDLMEPVAPGQTDCRVQSRSVSLLPAGIRTRWLYATPLHDTSPRLQTLHLRLTDDFAAVLERARLPQTLQLGLNVQVPGLMQRMERALAAFESPDAFRALAVQSAALSAASLLLDPQAALTAARASCLTLRRRRALAAYVEAHLTGDLTVNGMAESVGLSPYHFIRVFKAATGITPYAWVVGKRLERIKAALIDTEGTLADIARRCGFATQSHMTEVFRRAVGTTPGRWRQEHRGSVTAPELDEDLIPELETGR
ncbi:helix-turn-helix domain-containing protein [Pannonibacter tanglangensis]|uniref:Helix-turn-helix domain-containing protein n=1 Tax=Pannonibacter tanglangensis TaxID=2750084 RepID=A0ABW9ZG79_9HYPH|nr:AraC family transcriptional regulator [Pannonibacter sp. XCT-34]NBN63852.1 helix-turn-helix domain-containing protein [Pannonibacter sp. XCT-34]